MRTVSCLRRLVKRNRIYTFYYPDAKKIALNRTSNPVRYRQAERFCAVLTNRITIDTFMRCSDDRIAAGDCSYETILSYTTNNISTVALYCAHEDANSL